jgi:predicted DNA-binding transcriptional regulator AlpA
MGNPVEVVEWSSFKSRVPGVSYRTFLRLSDEGKAPSYIRLSPRAMALFSKREVEEWIEQSFAPLNTKVEGDE